MEKSLTNQESICNKIKEQEIGRGMVEESALGRKCCLNWKAWSPGAGTEVFGTRAAIIDNEN